MLIGNQSAQQLFQQALSYRSSNPGQNPSFFILAGPSHIGKTTLIKEKIGEILGNYITYDFLHVRDMSWVLGKRHTLKIDAPSDDDKRFIADKDGSVYDDVGIREVNQRLQKSGFSGKKIVYIENMERINGSAANAFLKTCEEPLANRLIIATTSHQSQLMDTILSRALVIPFHALSVEETNQYMKKHAGKDGDTHKRLPFLVMGKPGLIERYFAHTDDEEMSYVHMGVRGFEQLSDPQAPYTSLETLISMQKAGYLESFLDAWIAYLVQTGSFLKVSRRLEIKKMLNTNVSVENLLLYGVLE